MVKVGDIIKLRPSVFEEEYPTSEWSEKYLYEDQFKHVSLRFRNLGQQGDMAKTIFGSSETVVEEIGNDDDGFPWMVDGQPFILITDRFIIIYPEALRRNEITVLPFEDSIFKSFETETLI
jgi:hypothetical protein